MTVIGTGITNPGKAFDFTRNTGSSVAVSSLPKDMIITFDGSVVPMVNAYRIWPYGSPRLSPSSFTIYGGDSATTSSWTSVVDVTDLVYTSLQWKQFMSMAQPTLYKSMKLTLKGSSGSTAKVYEMQFLVCGATDLNLNYPEQSYSFYAKHDMVNIRPVLFGMTSCSINPALPQGVNFDTTNCHISGMVTVAAPMATYTVTATAGSNTLSGTVSLTFTECQGTMLRILRTYKTQAEKEAFRIRNTDNDALLMEVAVGHSYPNSQDHVDYFCVTVDRFDVTLDCSYTYWTSGSFRWQPEQ